MGPRTDVFLLGSTLYTLLTGSPPFKPEHPSTEISEYRKQCVELAKECKFDRSKLLVHGIPEQLAAICLKAMAAEPEDRYPSAMCMAENLRSFLRRLDLFEALFKALKWTPLPVALVLLLVWL